jgi:[ribosomal protein S18]-alanine N-acetyltransferase
VHRQAGGDAVKVRVEVMAERASWRYSPPYDFYDDDGIPPKNPESIHGVRDEAGDLVGFCFFAPRGGAVYVMEQRPDVPVVDMELPP